MPEPTRYLSLILGEKIIALLDESGATETEKLCALGVAQSLVPVSRNSMAAKDAAKNADAQGYVQQKFSGSDGSP